MKKTLRISFNGKTYEVVAEVLDGESRAVAETGSASSSVAAPSGPVRPAPAPPAAGGDGAVLSPLAGKIVSITAGVGTAVKAGQAIITLEAMKMNTVVSAPRDGTVAAVHVNAGDAVEEGQLLMAIR